MEKILDKTEKKEAKKKVVKVAPEKYFFALGRRKTALAKVKLFMEGTGEITVNERSADTYFPTGALQKILRQALVALGLEKKVNLVAKVLGGGTSAQAAAASLALSRALVKANPDSRSILKKQGFLSRDARMKERKKPGLKRARRAPQWQKR